MLLECICRLCLTQYEDPNHLFVISCDNYFDVALASIFNKEIQPEYNHLYKICGNCGSKLLEFHNFYVNVLQNEDKLLDIVLNEKLATCAPAQEIPAVSSELSFIGNIENSGSASISEDDIEMSDDGDSRDSSNFSNESTSSSSSSNDFALNSSLLDESIEYRKPPKSPLEPMEVEPIKTPHHEDRRKTRCTECGVYVFNISQHKRCVHDFSGKQECEDCDAVFSNRLKLLMHRYYKHVPPRYQCQYCDKRVRTKGLLREHVYQKHYEGVYLYNCEYCDAQFNYRTSLVIHQKRQHPTQYEVAKNHRMAMRYRP